MHEHIARKKLALCFLNNTDKFWWCKKAFVSTLSWYYCNTIWKYTHSPIKIDIMNSERIEYRLHYYLPTKIYVFTVYRRILLRNLPSIYHIITLLLTLNVYTTQGKSISLVRRFNQTNSLVQLFDWTKMILSEENRISIPCHAFLSEF